MIIWLVVLILTCEADAKKHLKHEYLTNMTRFKVKGREDHETEQEQQSTRERDALSIDKQPKKQSSIFLLQS